MTIIEAIREICDETIPKEIDGLKSASLKSQYFFLNETKDIDGEENLDLIDGEGE